MSAHIQTCLNSWLDTVVAIQDVGRKFMRVLQYTDIHMHIKYIYIYVCVCVCEYIYIYMYMHMHTLKQTYEYISKQMMQCNVCACINVRISNICIRTRMYTLQAV